MSRVPSRAPKAPRAPDAARRPRRRTAPRRRAAPAPAAGVVARLLAEAERARRRAYAPYSEFKVGAAILLRDGRIVDGCNVENASYGLSMCAERSAVFKAVGEGVNGREDAVAIAIATRRGSAAAPCGACRQVLHEFSPTLRVYWRDARGRVTSARIEQLLAHPFTSTELPRPRRRAKGAGASRRTRR